MKRNNNIHGTSLSEILVVMALTGIIMLTVFDGFSLFRHFYLLTSTKNRQAIGLYENYFRLEALINSADSIRNSHDRLTVYRHGEPIGEIWLNDSLLICKLQKSVLIDTIFTNVSAFRYTTDSNYPNCIDSLYFTSGKLTMKFGITSRPERLALINNLQIEKNLDDYEDRKH